MLNSAEYLPKYEYHLSDKIVGIEGGRMMGVISFQGVPFDVIPENILDGNYDSLNGVILRIAKGFASRLEMFGHIDHFKTNIDGKYDFQYDWLNTFNSAYIDKLKKKDSYENIFYLTFILKPASTDLITDTIRDLEEILSSVEQSFLDYEPKILTSYTRGEYLYSQVYEFLGYLVNGFWEAIPVTSSPAREVIESSKLFFEYYGVEFRLPNGSSRHASFYDLKDFPDPTNRGILNPLLEAQYPFILVMSFSFLAPAEAVRQINAQSNKLTSSGDEAIEQIQENETAKGAITAGTIYFGELHCSIGIYGDSPEQVGIRGGEIRTILSASCGSVFNKANWTAPESFYSFFPSTKNKPRVSPKTTRNFFGMFSMNTHSSGKQRGNPIGDGTAVMPLASSANNIYHFNFHYSLMNKNSLGEKVAGHTLILGQTGSGKTTLQTALIAQLERFGVKIFALDREGSMRGLIEAMGGEYFTLEAGKPTGLNPFQLPENDENTQFLYDLVDSCGRREERATTTEDRQDIKTAVDAVLSLPFAERRFGMLLQSVPDRGEGSLYRRLTEWCYGNTASEDGRYAYALDNPRNTFDPSSFSRVGFDVKDFLKKGNPITEPLLAYLLHLKTLMQREEGILVTVIEEFWIPISYPTTAEQIKDILKTGRRRDEFLLLVSQSPADVISSPLLADILEQTQTKIFLSNPSAMYHDSVNGLGYDNLNLTEKEFDKLPTNVYLRQFLIKQGNQSCIAKLDLSGLEDYISVMAMAGEDFPYLEQAKSETSNNPNDFVPRYIELRKLGKQQKLQEMNDEKQA